jgi:hypothetical protein
MALPPSGALPGGTSGYGMAAMGRELGRLAGTLLGRRNTELHLSAVRLGQLVGAGHLQTDEAAAALVDAGRRLGLDDGEIVPTVRSGLSFGAANPRPGT